MATWYNFRGDLDSVPDTEGVYLLADDRHNVVYVGKANNLNSELSKHPDPHNPCLRSKNIKYFSFEENPNSETREAQLISEHNPECNQG
jgi:excinuclease UvrABC nuclease subunit